MGIRTRSIPLLATAFVLTACASGGGPSADSSPPALAYAMPDGGTLVYSQSDTVRVEVDMGGQTLPITQASDGVMSMDFTAQPTGLRVSATYLDLDASADNPMAGTERFSEADIEGAFVFDLTPRGKGTLVSGPELKGAAAQMVSAGTMAATIFPRLPDRPVVAGDRWVDTLEVVVDEEAGHIETRSISEYTVRGDTLVDGRTLIRVDFVSDDEREVQASEQGVDITQDLGGRSSGFFLWDPAARALHSQSSSSQMTGTMEVTGAPFPLGLTVEASSRMERGGG